jgi:seryl-tRNA(Sec) selenium transferase
MSNPQMDVCHKIMQILDDNAQQVPEGFYLEVCDQLKHLHVAVERYEPDERELGLNEAERMLNRKAEKLKEDREHLNECVLNYNKTATAYLEKVKKYNKAAASVKRVRAWQLAREARLDDREDNITLAQLQRTLILAE